MQTNLFPGCDILGQGFNPFAAGSTSLDSSTQKALRGQLYEFAGGTSTTVPFEGSASNPTATLPDGVDMETSFNSGGGNVVLCNSDLDLSDAVSASVGVSGSYGLFRGSVEATFAQTQCVSSSYYYCLIDGYTNQYILALDNKLTSGPGKMGRTIFEAAFVSALDNLATAFDPTNPVTTAAFKTFFTQFGSHVISSVTMGVLGRLVVAVERSFESESYNATLDVHAEYEGIVSGTAKSSIKYSKSDYNSNTQRIFVAHGGDPDAAMALATDPYGGSYKSWSASVTVDNLAVVGLGLTALWELTIASGQSQALQDAYAYFTLPTLAIPVYLYCAPDQKDFFYTSFESTANGGNSATQESIPSNYQVSGPAYYGLPQALTPSVPGQVVMHRYYNGHNHFYTTDPAHEQLNGYTEEADKYLVILDAGTAATNTNPLNRWSCATGAHWYAQSATDSPPPYQQIQATYEGVVGTVLASAAYDPFDISGVKLASAGPATEGTT